MANLTYRQAIQQAPAGTTTKNATLTSQEIDGNFKSLNDELITKAQRNELSLSDWTAKIEEIKARYPYPDET